MGVLWDMVCVVILIAALLVFIRKPLATAFTSFAVLALSVTAAFFLSLPLAALARPLLAPPVEKAAANRLADLYSAEHLATGRETVEELDLNGMIAENPPAFQAVLDRFGTNIWTLRALPLERASADVLETVTDGFVGAVSRGLAYTAAFLLLFLIGKLIQRRLELNRPPQGAPRGARTVPSAGLGLLTGLFWVFALSILLHGLSPYLGANTILLSEETMKSASFYQILNQINFFIWL